VGLQKTQISQNREKVSIVRSILQICNGFITLRGVKTGGTPIPKQKVEKPDVPPVKSNSLWKTGPANCTHFSASPGYAPAGHARDLYRDRGEFRLPLVGFNGVPTGLLRPSRTYLQSLVEQTPFLGLYCFARDGVKAMYGKITTYSRRCIKRYFCVNHP
jgi:hypothetical protein